MLIKVIIKDNKYIAIYTAIKYELLKYIKLLLIFKITIFYVIILYQQLYIYERNSRKDSSVTGK